MKDDLSHSQLDHTAEWAEAQEGAEDVAAALALRKELKKLDPLLDVVWAKRNAKALPYAERWYIVRWNELTVPSFYLVTNVRNEYACPGPQHLRMMQEADLTRSGKNVMEEYRKAEDAKEKAKQKRKERTREEFREKLLEKLNHVYDTRISVPRDV